LEQVVDPNVLQSYIDGNLVETAPYNVIGFERETSPTIRLDFDFSTIYFADETALSVNSEFLGSGTATLGVDYFLETFNTYGFETEFSPDTPVGDYEFIMTYSNTETLSTGNVLNWSYPFQTVTITKKLNNNSHISNINFVSDTVFSGLDTILDIVEMDELTYAGYLADRYSREIIVMPGTGITYNDYLFYNAYWCIGQVQRTVLDFYFPIFVLPLGGFIRLITDEANVADPSMQSINLEADFNPETETSFNYIHYRVYAEDYDMNNPLYSNDFTDYYVAVSDVTNNVRFEMMVTLGTNVLPSNFNNLHISLYATDGVDMTAQTSLFAYFYETETIATHSQMESSMSGIYTVIIDLPEGFDFTLAFSSPNVQVSGHNFIVENSIVPKRYNFTITITIAGYDPAWGQREVFNFDPSLN
jgi:hypothetical protein